MTSDDRALIDRCLAGDPDAFGSLMHRYQDRLYGTLVHLLGSTQDALDVAQDTFLLAYQNLASFRGDSAFYSWLFRIAHNAAVSFRRRDRRPTRSVDHQRDVYGDEPVDPRPSTEPSAEMMTDERRRLVQEALAELPEDYRTVLILKEMDGLRYEEIADMIGCPIGTVRSRIHRARSELKDKLERALKSET
ncbi:MAG: sigma-70 family RNA polymerase sigma factor [Planctomycetaceae bacterium]|nr:sigma-70 family RNA polymerase sigma factor [Planctomycetaceae bacterium]